MKAMSFQLHRMLIQRGFDRVQSLNHNEIWERSDARVHRYRKAEKNIYITYVQIDRLKDGEVIKSETFSSGDPLLRKAVYDLHSDVPTYLPVDPVKSSDPSIPVITHLARRTFNMYYDDIVNRPARDISFDSITVFFDGHKFVIPLYSIEFLDATREYFQNLVKLADAKKW